MHNVVRTAGLLTLFLLSSTLTPAATPKEIEAAKKRGTEWIKARYGRGAAVGPGADGHGIGPTCLSGLALLEADVPGDDPAVKNITSIVRNAAYTQTKTYQIALCLMYLDRYADPADVPLIQALAARLLVGQNSNGGWGYDCIGQVSQADEQRLRGLKADQPAGKLHPEVEKYGQSLATNRGMTVASGDDNSNSQFAIIAVWLSRKHGVPVDSALDLIEKRYLGSQNPQTGGWGYSGGATGVAGDGSPSMICAGLIGLSTGIARREERRAKIEQAKKEPPKTEVEAKKNPDDPFFNPPPKAAAEPKKPPPRVLDERDRAARQAFAGLGAHLAASAQAGRGALLITGGNAGHGRDDLYFLWSVERAGVIYGIEKISGVDWYEAGAHSIVHAQGQDGSWTAGGSFGAEVNTAFAMLFLCKSNLARDLSGKVQKETATEMRAGGLPIVEPKGGGTGGTGGGTDTNPPTGVPALPSVTGNQATILAVELTRATEKDWATILKKLRDTKGAVHTQALVESVNRLTGDKKKEVREVLAERLTRMTAKTLREMAKAEDAELRRGAVLAMAMKDDKAHIPDLVAALEDEEDFVVRAARAGLDSFTGKNFGPANNATAGEKKLAAESWRQWMAAQKK